MPVLMALIVAILHVLLQSIVAPGFAYALALAEASAAREVAPVAKPNPDPAPQVAFTALYTRSVEGTPASIAIDPRPTSPAPIATTVPKPTPVLASASAPVGGGSPGVLAKTAVAVTPKTYLPQPTSALRLGQRSYVAGSTPSGNVVPDSELVNSPTAAGFDMVGFVNASQGYITRYRERMEDGDWLAGPEILRRISLQYSIHPRMLIAMLEFQSGWITQNQPSAFQLAYPFGRGDPEHAGSLYFQARWAASVMNAGYYGRRLGTRNQLEAGIDGSWRAAVPDGLNAGTHGVFALLARTHAVAQWPAVMGNGNESFAATYRAMFGDPWRFELGQLVPDDLRQPAFGLPWQSSERWFYTGGPHPAWDEGSPWSALDFAAPIVSGCGTAPNWVVAVAGGVVVRSDDGELVLSLDSTQNERIGWSVFYMHLAKHGRVPVGTQVRRGDRLGQPSCEGGYSTGAHLHIARKFNGEWLSAVGRTPFVLDGWLPQEAGAEYQGSIAKSGVLRRAIAGRAPGLNSLP